MAKIKPPTPLRVAVISDIHAYQDVAPDSAPSHCCISELDPNQNPIEGLKRYIDEQQLTADILLCPGDLAHGASPVPLQHVWRELHSIKSKLKCSKMYTTTGNHDVDSRHAHTSFDAKGMLQALTPPYPFEDESSNDRYWSRPFVIIEERRFRLVVLNSSAYHGEGKYKEEGTHEFERGRISTYTLSLLKDRLKGTPVPPVNILLCHHHPHPHSELRLSEKDLMIDGKSLLDTLAENGQWIVIHGHKHHPKIEVAAGTNSSPIVFAAGSFSANLYRELWTNSRNQFHLLEFPADLYPQFGFVGRFRSWEWVTEHGWQPAQGNRLPANGGFGFRGSLDNLATLVSGSIKKRQIRWLDLASKHRFLDFLLPQELEYFVRRLIDHHSLVVEPSNTFPPTLVGRAP